MQKIQMWFHKKSKTIVDQTIFFQNQFQKQSENIVEEAFAHCLGKFYYVQ